MANTHQARPFTSKARHNEFFPCEFRAPSAVYAFVCVRVCVCVCVYAFGRRCLFAFFRDSFVIAGASFVRGDNTE